MPRSRAFLVAALPAVALLHCSRGDAPTPAPAPAPAPTPALVASATIAPAPETPPPAASVHASAAETALAAELDALDAKHDFAEITLSADGSMLAWVERFARPGSDVRSSVIHVLDRSHPGIATRTITAGGSATQEYGLAWSPDGKTLAFLSNALGKDAVQLYVTTFPADTAPPVPRKLTDLKGALDHPAFSPDGKTIALLFAENVAHLGPLEATAPVLGEVEAHVPVQRLVLIDATSGAQRPLTRADLYVYEYAWSPDGSRVAVIGAQPPGDRHWWVAKLFTVDVAGGTERTLLAPPKQIAQPCWSPDGKSIAFISGLMSDEGSTGGDVFVLPADGSGPARNLTPGFHGSAEWISWPKGERITFAAAVDGRSALQAVSLGGKIDVLWSGGDDAIHEPALSADGSRWALSRQSFSKPPELWEGSLGNWQQVTHANDALRATWGPARSVTWKSDGREVQGWLIAPAPDQTADPKKLAPLVVHVHGGPAAMVRPSFGTELASQGYFVFLPNPRGSFGSGEAFTEANVKDFGYGDMRDILAGLDEVIRTAPVDPNRVGIEGWSYGGFMTMWMVTQTTRFRAAIAGAGISNWQSYWGENAIGDWMVPYFGATVYDDPKVYARSSPIEFIKRAKTPTLLLVGENDGECPAPQSFEFWRGLEAQGVETQLVVYPGEGHGFRKLEHRRDRELRTIRWFDAHLGPSLPARALERPPL